MPNKGRWEAAHLCHPLRVFMIRREHSLLHPIPVLTHACCFPFLIMYTPVYHSNGIPYKPIYTCIYTCIYNRYGEVYRAQWCGVAVACKQILFDRGTSTTDYSTTDYMYLFISITGTRVFALSIPLTYFRTIFMH